MRYQIPREHQIPAGAVKVQHKASSAVVYLYANSAGRPCALAFYGKADKAVFRHYYRTEADREARVRDFFANAAAVEARKAERIAERKAKLAKPHKLQVGHILRSSWGYDQTNINFYQVTALVGRRMVELREIGQVVDHSGWLQGSCTPRADAFKGDAFRKMVGEDGCSVKIESYEWANLWDGKVEHWTAYH
jgi:hypothetical protein